MGEQRREELGEWGDPQGAEQRGERMWGAPARAHPGPGLSRRAIPRGAPAARGPAALGVGGVGVTGGGDVLRLLPGQGGHSPPPAVGAAPARERAAAAPEEDEGPAAPARGAPVRRVKHPRASKPEALPEREAAEAPPADAF